MYSITIDKTSKQLSNYSVLYIYIYILKVQYVYNTPLNV